LARLAAQADAKRDDQIALDRRVGGVPPAMAIGRKPSNS